MPELPEVEVTARRLHQQIAGARLAGWKCSGKTLRHSVPKKALNALCHQAVISVTRRAKYVLMEFSQGWLAIHLGMSGTLRCCEPSTPGVLHDHVRLQFRRSDTDQVDMVFHDPRRFGSFRWMEKTTAQGQDLAGRLGETATGIEPLGPGMDGDYLYRQSRGRKTPIKPWLMNGRIVVGVGNIYACEALFACGIYPGRAAGSISRQRFAQLAQEVRRILQAAIRAGGSTISDFQAPDGQPGRYGQSHQVYGQEGKPCPRCGATTGATIRRMVQGQRSTFYCRVCQR